MTNAPAEPQGWPKRRWGLTIIVVLAGQLGLIFWLNEPDPAALPSVRHLSISRPAERTAPLPGLRDPTLSALPTRQGFSGGAWLNVAALPRPDLDWTEPPRWLPQQTDRLGDDFMQFVSTNEVGTIEVLKPMRPQVDLTENFPVQSLAPTQTTVRVEGELADRPLVSPLLLPPWPAADLILSNSVVQVAVAADGRVFSAKLLRGSGAKEADSAAVSLAQTARFQPLPGGLAGQAPFPPGGPAWGVLIFRWLTIAPPTNNAPTAAP